MIAALVPVIQSLGNKRIQAPPEECQSGQYKNFMVIDAGTTGPSEVSQFPNPLGHTRGENQQFDYAQTFKAEGRQPTHKFLVHLPDDTEFSSQVYNQTKERKIWYWWPTGPNETQCARAAYDILNAGGLPLYGYGWQGEILPGDLSVLLERLASSQTSHSWSVTQIK